VTASIAPVPELHAARQVVERLNDPDTGGRYERWIQRARGCTHPVRLRGVSRDAAAATGEVAHEFSSQHEPDGVLLTPCGNRRAHVCGACSSSHARAREHRRLAREERSTGDQWVQTMGEGGTR
jgi:hypothetical protein